MVISPLSNVLRHQFSNKYARQSHSNKCAVHMCVISSIIRVRNISKNMEERLSSVEMWFYRRMLRVSWMDKLSN